MNDISFSDIAIVACGIMRMELTRLQEEGFLNTEYIYYTTPGLHQDIHELERPLVEKINKANEKFPRHTGGANVLDGIGYLDQDISEDPEEFLDYCDWMGIPLQGYPTSLHRLKSLLTAQVKKL